MKKIWIFYILLNFLLISKIAAFTYQCEYTNKDSKDKLILEFDTDNKTVKNINEKQDKFDWGSFYKIDYEYIYNITKEEIGLLNNQELNNDGLYVCPVIYSATYWDIPAGFNRSEKYYYFSDGYLRNNNNYSACIKNEAFDVFCALDSYFESLSITIVNYNTYILKNDSEINKDKVQVSLCGAWDIVYADIEEFYKQYSNCNGSSCSNFIIKANETIGKLTNFCRSVYSYRDIYVDDDLQDTCVKNCLNFENEIKKLQEKYGIETDSGDGECGISQKLALYISNIVKWAKYIIPVIVIVLGILDFIKAIAADKDDEMKKAQGRFVKRLIAAALIFIIPFIIEFVLDKMGFGTNGCGIIDL